MTLGSSRLPGIIAFAAANHGIVSHGELHELGVPDSTVDSWVKGGALERRAKGVYHVDGLPWTWTATARAAGLALNDQAALGYRTAAMLWELDGARRGTIEATSLRGTLGRNTLYRRRETLDLGPADVTAHHLGVPVTTPIRTLIDVARFVNDDRLGLMIDDAHRRGLASYSDIATRFSEVARRGRPGVVRMREVLKFRLSSPLPAANTFELKFEKLVLAAGFPPPVRQFRVEVDGRTYYIDFAWPDYGVGAECDSMLVHSTPGQLAADLERQNRITSTGLLLKRFTYRDVVGRPHYVIAEVARSIPRIHRAAS